MAIWSEVNSFEVLAAKRMDAEYFQPKYLRVLRHLASLEGAQIVSLGTLLTTLTNGHTPRYHDLSVGDIPFLTAEHIQDFSINFDTEKRILTTHHNQELKRTRLQENDILVTIKGRIGNAALVHEISTPTNINQDVALLRPQPSVSAYFIVAYLNSSVGKLLTEQVSTGQINPFLSLSNLGKIQIPLFYDINDWLYTLEQTLLTAYQRQKKAKSLYAQAEALLLHELGLGTLDLSHQTTFTATFAEVMEARRLDAEYFHPEKQHFLEQLNKLPGDTVSHYFTSVSDIFVPPSRDNGVYLSNYDLTDALNFFLAPTDPVLSYTMGSNKKKIRRGDVVISRLRSYLREIALVNVPDQEECVGSTEFIVLRPRDTSVTPELLLMYLRSEPVQKILKWCQDGSNHPRFQEKEVLNLRLPNRILAIQNEIQSLVQSGIASYFEASRLLEQAKQRVEDLILKGITTAT